MACSPSSLSPVHYFCCFGACASFPPGWVYRLLPRAQHVVGPAALHMLSVSVARYSGSGGVSFRFAELCSYPKRAGNMLKQCILYRWIHVVPGSSQYTQSFTSVTDQDVKQTITRHLRPIFCDPAKDFKQLKDPLDPSLQLLIKSADSRLQREGKSSNKVSSLVDVLAQDCLQVRGTS